MPEISRFFGIVVRMFHREHAPPHFHAEYGDDEVLIDIDDLSVYRGALSPRAMGLVLEWAALHRGELRRNWELARREQPLARIEPLR
jgi:hypothetical protein